jgi:hypothetical protein
VQVVDQASLGQKDVRAARALEIVDDATKEERRSIAPKPPERTSMLPG